MKIKIEIEGDYDKNYYEMRDIMRFKEMRKKIINAYYMVYNKRKYDDAHMSDDMYDFLVQLEEILEWNEN